MKIISALSKFFLYNLFLLASPDIISYLYRKSYIVFGERYIKLKVIPVPFATLLNKFLTILQNNIKRLLDFGVEPKAFIINIFILFINLNYLLKL